jgi:hypothetical protein
MMNDLGPRLVATGADSFAMVDPDGSVSVRIQTTPRDANDPYRIRYFRSSQEIYDGSGKTVARTTDPEMAQHIRSLLIVWDNMQKKKASGSSPDASQEMK